MDKNQQTMPGKKLILLDLDGVVLDSKTNMALSWASVQEEFSISTPFDDYFLNIGRPFCEIMKILGHSDLALDIEDIYKNASIDNIDKLSFYENAQEVLGKLVELKYKLGIVTSKDAHRTKLILDRLDINFSVVQTPDNICRGKPSPDHILIAMAHTNTDPSETVYIGDMHVDYLAAILDNIDYYHATWGYSPEIECNVNKLDQLKDIIPILEGN